MLIDAECHGRPTEMYAYVAIDDDGKSGICAAMTPLGLSPLVGMTKDDMRKWKPYVRELRNGSDKEIRLMRYSQGKVVRE